MATIELVGLPSASVLGDADLLHLRVGDIDRKITGEDFKASILPVYATTTVPGIVEKATQTEVNDGVDNERYVTPLTLKNLLDSVISASGAPNATTTNRGLVELATTAEGQAGTDTERAVTPQVMRDSVTTHVSQATTTLAGKARIATQTEVNTGTDNTTIVTPLTLKNAPGVSVPDATTTAAGKIELATQGEVNLGTDDVRAVTPATLANSTWVNIPSASTAVQGKVELADLSETQIGTDQTRAVTPYGLKNALPTLIPAASETNAGIAEIATLAEVNAGTDTVRYVTPYTLAQSLSGTTVPLASETVAGRIEIATTAEAQGGSDNTRAVTPYGLKNALPSLIPEASENVKGIAEIATLAEVNAGTDTVRYVTPYTLAKSLSGTTVPLASETVAGRIEIATTAEVQSGSDQTRAVTPYGLKNALPTFIPAASETNAGIAEIATLAEVNAGSDTARYVTPYTLAQSLSGSTVPLASETVAGRIEIATTAEVQSGSDQTRAVTPYGLKNALPLLTPAASETNAGIAEIATLAEVNAGTDTVRYVTPYTLAQSLSGSTVPLASETVAGRIEIATTAEAQAGSDNTRAITPLKLKNSVMTHVLAADGPGSGLDADTLDGVQGSGYALVSHEHPWPTGLSFNTSTGVLTMARQTGGNLTASFDGRYLRDTSNFAKWTRDQAPGFGPLGGGAAYFLESSGSSGQRALSVRNLSSVDFSHGLSGYALGPNSIGVIGYAYSSVQEAYGVAGFSQGSDPNATSAGYLGGNTYSVRGLNKPIYSNSGYSPFTGIHNAMTPTNIGRFLEEGDLLVCDDSVLVNVNDSVPVVSLSKDEKCKKVIGVMGSYNRMTVTEMFESYKGLIAKYRSEENPDNEWTEKGKQLLASYAKYKQCEINSVGEGGINVCDAGGDIEIGDYLCSSSVSGKAMKQDDDILHNYTVAKAMQDVVWENEVVGKNGCYEKNGHKWKMIGCTYHCG